MGLAGIVGMPPLEDGFTNLSRAALTGFNATDKKH